MARHRKPLSCWFHWRRHDWFVVSDGDMYADLVYHCRKCRSSKAYPGIVYER